MTSSLHYEFSVAVLKGDVIELERLLNAGADICVRNDQALQTAAKYGYLPVVRLLVDRGAEIHAWGEAALCDAAFNGHLTIVQFLLDRGANPHADNGSPLSAAVCSAKLPVVQLLLDRGADIHANRDKALTVAASRGHREVVTLLLHNGADATQIDLADLWENDLAMVLNYLTPEQRPALMEAVTNNACRSASELIRLGSDPDADNKAALRLAIRKKNPDMVATLIAGGASIEGIKTTQPRIAEILMTDRIRQAAAFKQPGRTRNRIVSTL